MGKNWKHHRASERIEKRLDEVADPTIVDYTRDRSLENIPSNKAYRTDGAHLYADILNVGDMLNCTDVEGEMCHKRTLRFLNQHFRAARRVLNASDVKRVDFANQRVHAVALKPYNTEDGAEATRVHIAIAVAQMIIDVLAETGDTDEKIPDAKVRVGIDTGKALAVNNGRRGGREPLFLGSPANKAAKRAAGGATMGIYPTNKARAAIGLKPLANAEIDKTPLTREEIRTSQDKAKLPVSKDTIVKQWKEDMKANPIGAFEFSRHTPPLCSLDIQSLTPGNSRRQEAVSIYADLDGFTNYVDKHIDHNPEDVVQALHVIRSEMDTVISSDFEGRKIRFIGDCEHALIAEGTAHTTDDEQTVSTAVLCVGGVRSSFDLCLEKLNASGVDVQGLAIAIGFEYGPMTVTRLGMQGDRVRCSVSRGVLASEHEQHRCDGHETAIGKLAYGSGSSAVRRLFERSRKVRDLDYDSAVETLARSGDKVAKAALREAQTIFAPAVARAADQPFKPHCCPVNSEGLNTPK
jgi:class 3 adenylate cyclase